MRINSRITCCLRFILILCVIPGLYAQEDVEIKAIPISDNIYMLTGQGGNMGLMIGEETTFLIDDQYAPLSEKIMSKIKELTDQPVKYLANTHWHGDHTGGNENFGKKGTVIVAHKNVRERLSTDQHMKAFNRMIAASPKAAWPEITYENELTLHINGEDIHIFHVHNAHTDGDSFVWFEESNVLHMGDCFFNKRFPFIDLGSGGSIKGCINAVSKALMIVNEDTKIIPGHGELANMDDLYAYHKMLKTMNNRVEKAVAEGKSIEEMKTMGMDEGYEEWGKGFISADKFIDMIWTDLTRAEE